MGCDVWVRRLSASARGAAEDRVFTTLVSVVFLKMSPHTSLDHEDDEVAEGAVVLDARHA